MRFTSSVLAALLFALLLGLFPGCGEDSTAPDLSPVPTVVFEGLEGPVSLDGPAVPLLVRVEGGEPADTYSAELFVDGAQVSFESRSEPEFELDWEALSEELRELAQLGRRSAELEVKVTSSEGLSITASTTIEFTGGVVFPKLIMPLENALVLMSIPGSTSAVTLWVHTPPEQSYVRFQVARDESFAEALLDDSVPVSSGRSVIEFVSTEAVPHYWRAALIRDRFTSPGEAAWTAPRRIDFRRFRRSPDLSDIVGVDGIASNGAGGVLLLANRSLDEISYRHYDSGDGLVWEREIATTTNASASHLLVPRTPSTTIACTGREIQIGSTPNVLVPHLTALDDDGMPLWDIDIPETRDEALSPQRAWLASAVSDGSGGALLSVRYDFSSDVLVHVNALGHLVRTRDMGTLDAFSLQLVDPVARSGQALIVGGVADLSVARFDSTWSEVWRRDIVVDGAFEQDSTHQALLSDGSTLIAGTWVRSSQRPWVYLARVGPNGSLDFEKQVDLLFPLAGAPILARYVSKALCATDDGGAVLIVTIQAQSFPDLMTGFLILRLDSDAEIVEARQVVATSLIPMDAVATTDETRLHAALGFSESGFREDGLLGALVRLNLSSFETAAVEVHSHGR